jgi:transposase-like protein
VGEAYKIFSYKRGESCTINAIESVNASLRKVTKTGRSFPSRESVMKVLYLALHQITKKWAMPIRDWKQAMSQFMMLFGDRISY